MPPHTPTPADREVFTPSRLNALARELLEGAFPLIWVEGELSNVARPSSGHLYFTLKDPSAQVRCAMFRPRAMYLRFRPADGQRVLMRARVSLYEGRGEFQLIVEHLEEAGEGALRREFEQLRAQLAAEGLFETARKRALPRFVRRLGVLTSPTGAAVRDVLTVLGRRFPLLPVEILPVPVQGAEAPPKLRAMLAAAIASERYDVLLLTRGGGSLEDLWAFNDEALVRAIAASPVPIVSAVGHEVDATLADFAADLRAPTPSAAAEVLVPDADDLARQLDGSAARARRALRRALEARAQRLDTVGARLQAQHPARRLALQRARLAALHSRLLQALHRRSDGAARRLGALVLRLQRRSPAVRLGELAARLQRLSARLSAGVGQGLERRARRLAVLGRTLNAVSPLATLERGYAILRRPADGAIVASVRDVAVGDRLDARLADGTVSLQVEHVHARREPDTRG